MHTEPSGDPAPCKTLWDHVRTVSAEIRRSRPVSFYLLFAIIAVLLLGAPLLDARSDPRRFAFFLVLYFVFFFAVIVRALLDAFEIIRGHLREQRRLYRDTLGDAEFAENLGRRVRDRQEKD